MRTWQMVQVPVEGLNGIFKLELDFDGGELSLDEFSFHQKSCLSRKYRFEIMRKSSLFYFTYNFQSVSSMNSAAVEFENVLIE